MNRVGWLLGTDMDPPSVGIKLTLLALGGETDHRSSNTIHAKV